MLGGEEEAVGGLGVEHHHAADGARAVGVGDGAAHDFDRFKQVGIDEEHRGRAVARTGEILPCAVDDDLYAAEILEAADVGGGAGAAGVGLDGDAGGAEEDVIGGGGHAPGQGFGVDLAHRGHGFDGRLAGAADDGDAVEQHRALRHVAQRHVGCLDRLGAIIGLGQGLGMGDARHGAIGHARQKGSTEKLAGNVISACATSKNQTACRTRADLHLALLLRSDW